MEPVRDLDQISKKSYIEYMPNSSRQLALVIVTPVYEGDNYEFESVPEAIEFITTHQQMPDSENLTFAEYHVVLKYQHSKNHVYGTFEEKQDAIDYLNALDAGYH